MMRFSLIILVVIFPLCFAAFAGAMSLSCSFYNSDDSLDVSLDGENFNFKGSAILDPSSLYYSNGGGSTKPDCSYDYELSFNGRPLAVGAKSDSGAFTWHAEANSNYCGDGARSAELSAKNMVKDGTLSSYYSNPDHRVEEVVDVDGAQYVEGLQLSDVEMNARGQGSSYDEEFFYSFDQTLDEETMGTGAKTSSGAGVFEVSVASDEGKSAEEMSTLSVTNYVVDGSLRSSYYNPDLDVVEAVDVQNAVYMQRETISQKSIDSKGNGVTIEKEGASQDAEVGSDAMNGAAETSSAQTGDKGLHHDICVNGLDKWGTIEADVAGDIEAQWKSAVKSDSSAYSLGVMVEGYGTTTEMDDLKMIGKAQDFPTQTLPAGSVDISFNFPYQDKGFLDSLDLYYKESQDFCEDYEVEISPALYYYLNQKCYINPFEIPPDPSEALLPEDYYIMNMAFTVDGA
jgi:hypothetical protein